MTEKTNEELILELANTSAEGKAGGDLLLNMLESLLNKEERVKLYGHKGAATDADPITVTGTETVLVDSYTFTLPEAATIKLDVLVRWRLTVPNTSAIYTFKLDGDVILTARKEPKDGNNEDYLYVFGLIELDAGTYTVTAEATKSGNSGNLIISANAFTREELYELE